MLTVSTAEPRPVDWSNVFAPAIDSAAAALTAWTSDQITLSLDEVQELPLEEVSATLEVGDTQSIMVLLDVIGDYGGQLILQFDEASAPRLVTCLLGGEPPSLESWGPLELSALAETGNILASAYLSRITDLIGCRVLPSPPNVLQDFAACVLENATMNQAMACEHVLLCRTQFRLRGERLSWNMFFVPSLELLTRLRACDVELSAAQS